MEILGRGAVSYERGTPVPGVPPERVLEEESRRKHVLDFVRGITCFTVIASFERHRGPPSGGLGTWSSTEASDRRGKSKSHPHTVHIASTLKQFQGLMWCKFGQVTFGCLNEHFDM